MSNDHTERNLTMEERVEELERLVDWLTEHIRRTPQVELAYGHPMYIHVDPPMRITTRARVTIEPVYAMECPAKDWDGNSCEGWGGHKGRHHWQRGNQRKEWA